MEYLLLLGFLKIVDGAFSEAFDDNPRPQQRISLNEQAQNDLADEREKATGRRKRVSVGGGANYLDFEQRSDDGFVDLNFELFSGPAIFAALQYQASEKWLFDLQVKSLTGEIDDGTLTLSDRDLSWQSTTLDVIYFVDVWNTGFFGTNPKTGVLLGAQYHEISVLDRESPTAFSIDTRKLSALSLGFYRHERLSPKWTLEYWMRFQPPVSNPSDDRYNLSFSFDGSVALIRYINEAFSLGLYSYGQYQDAEIKYQDNFLSSEKEGDIGFLHSNLEARAIYKF